MKNQQQGANKHADEQFKPNTTVAAVIVCNNKFLLVEEQEYGKTVYNTNLTNYVIISTG
ncbi:hypothetical protein [Thalassotalea piscium]|uniref:Uncharacterized protein n=1 Tax=Thalassotalea piscium TaxID=1230533 RepID=A0A7X0TTL3_9GAMM|nr:hypothetical protein [Thalassotalea piscium]MBB6543268.1 hypothetical protein [Thalassotalea piscium]